MIYKSYLTRPITAILILLSTFIVSANEEVTPQLDEPKVSAETSQNKTDDSNTKKEAKPKLFEQVKLDEHLEKATDEATSKKSNSTVPNE